MRDERRIDMKQPGRLSRYCLFALLGVLLASGYPLYMGVRVIGDMLRDGVVLKENYPKYVIPYTPICIAVMIGLLLLPVCLRLLGRFALAGGSAASLVSFFALELLLEKLIVVSGGESTATLEDWQMFMCYIPADELLSPHKTKTAVEILMGDYDPAFKLHFYLISVVLVLSVLHIFYGFAQIIRTGDRRCLKALVLQSVCTLVFLGLCILACFTAFFRDGSLQISPVSATWMTLFFLLLGVTAGIYTGSFLLGRRGLLSIGIPALVACVMTLFMYAGEAILLHGNLYRFGSGFLWDGLPGILLAPIDLLIVAAAGCFTAAMAIWMNGAPARRRAQ